MLPGRSTIDSRRRMPRLRRRPMGRCLRNPLPSSPPRAGHGGRVVRSVVTRGGRMPSRRRGEATLRRSSPCRLRVPRRPPRRRPSRSHRRRRLLCTRGLLRCPLCPVPSIRRPSRRRHDAPQPRRTHLRCPTFRPARSRISRRCRRSSRHWVTRRRRRRARSQRARTFPPVNRVPAARKPNGRLQRIQLCSAVPAPGRPPMSSRLRVANLLSLPSRRARDPRPTSQVSPHRPPTASCRPSGSPTRSWCAR